MTYKKQGNKGYANKRRMFNPAAFTSGFQGAMQKVEELAAQGWMVETDQGALDSAQAAELQKEAVRNGFDTEIIPIMKDGDDVVAQFLAVKPKSATAPAAPAQQAGPPVTLTTTIEPEQVEANFVKEFYAKGKQPDNTQSDNGFIMAPNRLTCLIRRDAAPVTQSPLTDASTQALQNPWGALDMEAVQALGLAKNTKTRVALGPSGSEVRVTIDILLKGIRSLGGSTATSPGKPIQMVAPGKDQVLYLGNSEGDRVCIAPVVGTFDVDDITYNDALSNYRNNIGS